MGISPSSVTQNGVTAWLTLSDSTVTVSVSSMSYSWRINGTNSGGDHGTYYIRENRNAEDSFEAEDGHKYAFQVCSSSGNWSNGAVFTVTFDDSGGGGGDGGGSGEWENTLYIEDNGVTTITVERTWSDVGNYSYKNGSTGKVYLSDNSYIYYPSDRFVITASPKDGYEIDYYDNGEPFYTENLTRFYSESDGVYRYKLTYSGDSYVTATATPIATARIYDSSYGWDRYTPYIYDASSGWERYVPYVYNGTGWDRYS